LRFSIVHAGQSAIENRQSAIIENRQSAIENRSEVPMVGQHHFISYSAVDAEAFALKLADDLQAGPPSFPVWIFRRDLHPAGRDWDAQIRDAIRDGDSLIFVMSRDSVTDESNCKPEWTAALKFKKPILLVRCHADAEAPFRLASRQYVDFVGDYNIGLARLRKDLQWLHSPQGELQTLKYRLADAKRDYARASDEERARIQADIEQLQKEIAERERVLNNPDAAARETEVRIRAGIEREREPIERVKTTTKFINPPPLTAPPYFQDRHIENRHIANFLRDDSKRLLTINGRSGIGKTAMICRILKSLESGILPDDLGALTVDGIVYLSALGTRPINLPNLFADLCKLLPADTARQLDALYRDPKISTRQKMLALLEQFPHRHVLVLLDNFETVMDVSACCLTDAELDDALRTLLDAPHHAVKVILTTRIPPRDLQLYHPERQAYLPVDEGLAPEYAKQLLRELDADGRVGLKQADDAPLARAVERTRGFPRALEALYAILSADRYTTLEEILAAPLPENVVEALVGEAFSRLDALAQRVMQALAAYNRPVPPAAVDYLLQPFLPNINSAPVLQRLVNMQFAHRESGKFYLHPADREYAWGQVKSEKAKGKSREDEWAPKNLLSRAADYFRQTRLPRERWKTLDDLAPQLAEFDLRCAAEDYDTAADVLTDIDFDYLLLWGHYRLMIEMHERVRGKIRVSRLEMSCLNNLVFDGADSSLGQTRNAIDCYEEALEIARERGDKAYEGVLLGNLGGAYADLGETRRAIEFYEQALAIDREIGDRRGEGADLGNLGLAYADLGETRRAIEFYEQALATHREIGDRRGEGADLGNLGGAYHQLGETRRAIEFYEQALAIAREIGDRRGEGADLGNLGIAYAALGETRRAIEYYEQALAIAREIGDRNSEGSTLSVLGNALVCLGETERAIELFTQAVGIARETGYRYGEGFRLLELARIMIDREHYPEAIAQIQTSIQIGEEISRPDLLSNAYCDLALAHLYAAQEQQDPSGLQSARAAAERACHYDVPENNHNAFVLLGIIALAQSSASRGGVIPPHVPPYTLPHIPPYTPPLTSPRAMPHATQGDMTSPLQVARTAFTTAIAHADTLLARTPELYDALDARGMALCGLVLCDSGQWAVDSGQWVGGGQRSSVIGRPSSVAGHPSLVSAVQAFRAARKINSDAGIVARVVRKLDALARTHPNGAALLAEARRAASGNTR
jgi:tetratricopeptide (TPR) repeat protein